MSTEEKVNAEGLVLRAKPKRVTRLNRKVIAVLVLAIAVIVVLAMMWGLRRPQLRTASESIDKSNVERVARAEGLEALPRDYASIPKPPRLGAPLGELGKPVLNAERRAGLPVLPEQPSFRPSPEEDALRAQRLKEVSEAEQAAKGGVFFELKTRNAKARDTGTSELPLPTPPPASLPKPQAPYRLNAGTLVSAALLTGIKSDLPGQILGVVTENVFDSTGREVLIPQGSKLVGEYDSKVAYGQRRILQVWTRLIFPNDSSIPLDRIPGSDPAGYAGLEDGVDWHWGRIFSGAALSALLGSGAELAAPDRSNGRDTVVVAARTSVQDTVNQVGQEITRRNLDIQPTLTARPALPFRLVLNKELVLPPYR